MALTENEQREIFNVIESFNSVMEQAEVIVN